MATSDTPKFPRFIRSTIILPPKETDHVYDANGKTMDEELNCMEVDGVDPGGIHVPDYDFVSLWKETKGPYKVREVKDLQAVIDSGSLTIPQLARVKAWRGEYLLLTAEIHTYHQLNSGRGDRHGPLRRRQTNSYPCHSNSLPGERDLRPEELHRSPILLDRCYECPILQPREYQIPRGIYAP